jgi:hypothetical protein
MRFPIAFQFLEVIPESPLPADCIEKLGALHHPEVARSAGCLPTFSFASTLFLWLDS